MRICRGACAVMLLGAAVLSGCSTTKSVTHFYSLMPTLASVDEADRSSAAPATPTAPAAPLRYFELLPVSLPLQDDQPQLVTEQPDGSFAVLEQQRWVGPLKNEIRDALAYRLSLRFADTEAGRAPASGGARALWRIVVDVQRFDSAPGRYARLDAAWSLRSPTDMATTLICRSVFEESAANDYPSLVQAHRAAVGRLGDVIADAIFKVQGGGTAVCP